MADPQAFQFWAPPTPSLDTSPIMRGAEASAAGMLAAGQALGQGIKEGRARADEQEKIKKREEASKEISKIMDELSNEKNYDTVNNEPWLLDPSLGGLNRDAARTKIAATLVERGVPQDVAWTRAVKATSPHTQRIYKSGFEPQLRTMMAKAQVLASQAGMDPGTVNAAIALSMQDSFANAGLAERAAADFYMNTIAPPEEAKSYIEAAIRGKAEREKEAFLREQNDRAFAESRLNAETAWGRRQEELKIQQKIAEAEANNDVTRKAQLMALENSYAKDRISHQQRLEEGTRVKLMDMENESRREIAQLKGGGVMGEAEEKAFSEFLAVQENAITFDTVTEAPLTDIPGILGATGLDSMVGPAKGAENIFFDQSGARVSNDYRGVFAYFDESGNVKLRDVRDDESRIPQEQLDKAARALFSNEKARFAVAMQMVYGGQKVDKSDLEKLYAINRMGRQFGGEGVLDRTIGLLVQAKKDRAAAGFINEQGGVKTGTDAHDAFFGGRGK